MTNNQPQCTHENNGVISMSKIKRKLGGNRSGEKIKASAA